MLIDCATCTARHVACGDCVVTVLLGSPPREQRSSGQHTAGQHTAGQHTAGQHTADPFELDEVERAALGSLALAGLIPPLRLARAVPAPPDSVRDSA